MPPYQYQFPSRNFVSQREGARIEAARVPRSKFMDQYTRKTAFDAGYLVPIVIEEILPGDHISYDMQAYIRMSTPLFPLFDNQRIDTHFFFVPNRLLWDNWEKFMGAQANPGDSIAYTIPVVSTGQELVGSIYDHMGLVVTGQITPGEGIQTSALPFRAYNLIWNEWFRDENIQSSQTVDTSDGPDVTPYALLRRAKAHDYFTSALPNPQKFTAPTVPLGGRAPLTGIGKVNQSNTVGPQSVYETGGPAVYADYALIDNAFNDSRWLMQMDSVSDLPGIYADLSSATGVSINQFRLAYMIQSLMERDARGGTRYVELVKSHFGVNVPDYRLQRPEYIGGGSSALNITPIAQTAPTTGVPLGALGGAATAHGSHRASYAAVEHGWIIGLISVRSENSYQQGVHRSRFRETRYDFYFPDTAQLGEQAILRREIYCTGDDVLDETAFGYQEAWHEYRTKYSEVTGIMRSTATGTLDAWHLAQKFTSPPLLNGTFIADTPPMTRVLAAGSSADGQQYFADLHFNWTAVRPIPMYGTPALLGRF